MQTIIATIVVLAAAGWVARNGYRVMMSATQGAGANGDQGGCGSCGGCSAKRKKSDPPTNAVPLVSISGKVSRLHSDN